MWVISYTRRMLQDKYLSQFDFQSQHEIEINGTIESVYPIVSNLDFSRSKIIYWLFKLRGMPVPESLSLVGLEKLKFLKLEIIRNEEIIIGLIGQFWTPTGNLQDFDPVDFAAFDDTRFAKSTWSFELEESGSGKTLLKTETRILCPDPKYRRRFARYWASLSHSVAWLGWKSSERSGNV